MVNTTSELGNILDKEFVPVPVPVSYSTAFDRQFARVYYHSRALYLYCLTHVKN